MGSLPLLAVFLGSVLRLKYEFFKMFLCFLRCTTSLVVSHEQTGIGEPASVSAGAWKPRAGVSEVPRSAGSSCSLQATGCGVVSTDGALAAPGAWPDGAGCSATEAQGAGCAGACLASLPLLAILMRISIKTTWAFGWKV